MSNSINEVITQNEFSLQIVSTNCMRKIIIILTYNTKVVLLFNYSKPINFSSKNKGFKTHINTSSLPPLFIYVDDEGLKEKGFKSP